MTDLTHCEAQNVKSLKMTQHVDVNVIKSTRFKPFFQGLFQFPYSNVQVKVHKMFKILSILDNFKIQQLGDVLEWFFRGFLKVDNLDMAK